MEKRGYGQKILNTTIDNNSSKTSPAGRDRIDLYPNAYPLLFFVNIDTTICLT